MNPGARRSYGNTGTCCGGTGLESHTKFQDSIYFHSTDGSALYVNLYLASTLHWPERGFIVAQETTYPLDASTLLSVDGRGRLDIKLRVPYWVRRGFTVSVNGVEQPVTAGAGDYVTISREWTPGDTIAVTMPFSLRIEPALDDPAVQSLAYGPVPLVLSSAATTYLPVTLYRDLRLDGDLIRAVRPTGATNTFSTNGYRRLGQARTVHGIAAHRRLRHRPDGDHVPHAARRRRHGPVRHHHHRHGRRATGQRHGGAADRPVGPRGGVEVGPGRHPLRQRRPGSDRTPTSACTRHG
jgi:hypothetical protein